MSRPPLRLVPKAPEPKVLTYRNRRGHIYYLHQRVTKKGAPKYFFAKTIGDGALAEMPTGFEVAESINGVVSVRRTTGSSVISEADVQLVRDELDKLPHLSRHVVERKGDAILVYEPEGGFSGRDIGAVARELGVFHSRLEAFAERHPTRYTPVMKFEPELVGKPGTYAAFRMTYRGSGGWMLLSAGMLGPLARKLLPHIGRESFFELM